MISLAVKIVGKEIYDSFEEKDITLEEVSVIMFRLEEIKQYLLKKKFKNKFEVKEGYDPDEEEP